MPRKDKGHPRELSELATRVENDRAKLYGYHNTQIDAIDALLGLPAFDKDSLGAILDEMREQAFQVLTEIADQIRAFDQRTRLKHDPSLKT